VEGTRRRHWHQVLLSGHAVVDDHLHQVNRRLQVSGEHAELDKPRRMPIHRQAQMQRKISRMQLHLPHLLLKSKIHKKMIQDQFVQLVAP